MGFITIPSLQYLTDNRHTVCLQEKEGKMVLIGAAARRSFGTKPPCWRAKVVLGQDKQKAYMILNGNFLCLSCPSVTFALQHGGFVPCE